MKIKLLFILLASMSLLAVSCDKDKSSSKKEVFEQKYSLDDVRKKSAGNLNSAAYYCEDSGYNIFFSQLETAPEGSLSDEPDGPWFMVDLPEGKTNGTYDLTESLSTENWQFYCYSYGNFSFFNGEFDEGYLKINLDEAAGTIDFEIDGMYYDGTHVRANYNGNISKLNSYIKGFERIKALESEAEFEYGDNSMEVVPPTKHSFELKSCGCYYSQERGGYDFIFTSDPDWNYYSLSERHDEWFGLDIHESFINGTYSLMDDLDSKYWSLYIGAPGWIAYSEGFESGSLTLNFDTETNTVEFKVDGVLENIGHFRASYSGPVQMSPDYLWDW